jgi:outer membrane protein assembly factor BamD (BamD/ComL family)
MSLKKDILFLILSFVFLSLDSPFGYAQQDRELFTEATELARLGKRDVAFMHFHSLLKKYSSVSKYYKEALFAAGEYYFSIGDYNNAEESFARFIKNYPDSEAFPFALVYLLKISRRAGDEKMTGDLQQKIIEFKQLSLLFSDFKESNYLSPLFRRYKAVYFIERVEFYLDGDLFEKIHF